jgi:hypothetical protein
MIVLESTLSCPNCGHQHTRTMPADRCEWYFRCPGCKELLRPRPGDCCVFCSYGTVPCPPIQEAGGDPRSQGG